MSLLEVMVAVAVLALLYTALAELSFQGLRMEGDAGRRFGASLLADATLTEIENTFRSGSAPSLGSDEFEQEPFTVETQIAPFDSSFLKQALAERARQDPRDAPPPRALLATGTGRAQPYLYDVHVAVRWEEAGAIREVVRTTIGCDAARARELLPEAASSGDETGEPGVEEIQNAIDEVLDAAGPPS
jgi:hypothetical protein